MKNHSSIPNAMLYLLIHSRGRLLTLRPLTELGGQLSETQLPNGINSFSVIDSLGNTYCERLYFARKASKPTIEMRSEKATYGKREAVELTFNLKSVSGKPCIGNYSISVTDTSMVKLDPNADNIMTNLLLCSDIKGYVEDPGSYFTDSIKQDRAKLDLLLSTQGWKRCNTSEVVKGNYSKNDFYMEVGQTLSGNTINQRKKPVKNCKVIMMAESLGIMKIAKTDSLGSYLIQGLDFPDSTSFKLRAKVDKGLNFVEIIPDADIFPDSMVVIPEPRTLNDIISTEYLAQSKLKYYTEGGQRIVSLNEVTVRAKKNEIKDEESFKANLATNTINQQRLEDFSQLRLIDIIAMEPGITIEGENTVYMIFTGYPILKIPALILINDVEVPFEELSTIETSLVKKVIIVKGPKALFWGSKGKGGVVSITLKRGELQKPREPVSQITFQPLGYQRANEFYVPKYEVDSVLKNNKADLRTTIYWNPKLVSDSNGTVTVKFYTADKANKYSVVLEGITDKGEICRYVGELVRKGE